MKEPVIITLNFAKQVLMRQIELYVAKVLKYLVIRKMIAKIPRLPGGVGCDAKQKLLRTAVAPRPCLPS